MAILHKCDTIKFSAYLRIIGNIFAIFNKNEKELEKMIQVSYSIKDTCEIDEIMRQLKEKKEYASAASVLLQIYSSFTEGSFILELLERIREHDPMLQVTGLTTSGEIFRGEICTQTVVLNFLIFEDSYFKIYEYDLKKTTQNAVAVDLLKKKEVQDLAGIMLFTTLNLQSVSDIIEILAGDDYPVFGSSVGIDVKGFTSAPKIIGSQFYTEGIIAVFFEGKNLHIKAEHSLGWIPLGKEMQITQTDSPFCISRIDDQEAVFVYMKYLNVEPNQYFLENIREFPLLLLRDGIHVARVPFKYDKEGRLYFTSEVNKGERIRLSYGSEKHIFEDVDRISKKINAFTPDVTMLISCTNRLSFLQEKTKKEIHYFQTKENQVNGFYSFSEFVWNKDKGGVFNSSLVAVGFREGDKKDKIQITTDTEEDNETKHVIPFHERLLYLLEVTTNELKQTNKKLEQYATTDALTKLYNRRRIEDIFEYESRKRNDKYQLSILMADIDYFKKVNDTYGHDTGDQVLKQIAEILKGSVRKGDSAGRWGGEEFMILLPCVTLEQAEKIAEEIRKRVEAADFEAAGKLTVSLGVTIRNENDSMKDVLLRVDEALYEAKKTGRNKVISKV